jgi:hypothetical protein
MKFTARITVYGMKASKGQLDNGTAFDSTKLYSLTDLDDRKGNAKGRASVEYTIGEAAEFDKYKHLPFPFDADADFEIVTNGKTQQTIVTGLRPVAAGKGAA